MGLESHPQIGYKCKLRLSELATPNRLEIRTQIVVALSYIIQEYVT